MRPDLALERLVYRSHATEAYRGAADLERILKVAAHFNHANHITGALALSDRVFVQVMEGPAASLNALMVQLGRDRRHTDLDILGRWPVGGRLFGAWAMAPAGLADASPRLRQRFQSDGVGVELVGLLFDAADATCPVRL